jgi:uncharacterized spore protein YtfJ
MKTKQITPISLLALLLFSGALAAQTQSPLEQPLANFDRLISNLKVSAVVGNPIQVGETTIIPFARISFGLGGGGAMMAFGGGMGGKTIPLGILIVEGENVRVELFPQEEKKPSFLMEMLPVLLKMLPQFMGNKSPMAQPKPPAAEGAPKEKSGEAAANASLDQVKKLFDQKEFAQAMDMTDVLIARDPNNAEYHVWKGHAMGNLAQGNPMNMMKYGMGAMQEYETAIQLDPQNPGAHFGRGVGRLMAPPGFGGDLDGAIQDLELACAKNPFPEGCYNLGEAYKRKGLNDKAKAAYKKALELNPKYSEAAQALEQLK